MGNALRAGLAGGLMGAMQGAHQMWEGEQRRIETDRLMKAKALEDARLAEIAAGKDALKHERSIELEDVKAVNRGALKEREISAADKRAEAALKSAEKRASESVAASDRRAGTSAAARVKAAEISVNKPKGEGTKAKSQLFANEAGEQVWVAPGEDIPAGFYRAPASGKPKVSQTAAMPAPGASRDNPVDAQATTARPPSGTWVRLPSGSVVQVP